MPSLADEVERATRALMALGVGKGDRVAQWAPNIWEWIVAALATHAAGGVLVPINTRFKASEAAYVLEKSGARVLFTVNGFLGNDYVAMLRASDVELARPRAHRAHARKRCPGDDQLVRVHAVSRDRVASAESTARAAERRARAISATSSSPRGRPGIPKGVMCTHAQSLRAFRDWSDTVGLRTGDRYLVVLPFFHTFGYKAGWLASFMMGATVLPQAVFDVGEVLRRVGKDRITVLPGPPALYQSILGAARPRRASICRRCVSP